MNKVIFFLVISLMASSSFSQKSDDHDWEVYYIKDGVTVYKAKKAHNSGVVPIKAKAIVNYSPAQILSVLSNMDKKADWIPNLEEARSVEVKRPLHRVEYSRYKAMWPIKDRDFVYELVGKVNKEEKSIWVDIRSIDHPKVKKHKKCIRGITYEGHLSLKVLAPNKTLFEAYLLTDFKGDVPPWVVNMVQKKWPYKSMIKMRKTLDQGFETMDDFKNLL